jgi:crossover junction endodeoxyribonuclease RuvC
MVANLLGLSEVPRPDHAADALAVAICHGGSTGVREAAARADAMAAREPVSG